MSIFDRYDLAQNRLVMKKRTKLEDGVYLQVPDRD